MGKETPKVTVLMGTYNRPDYLREAIRSVVNQSMKDWELLVMNDGGVDAAHVVDEFRDSRIRYFNDPVNKGLAVRLNFGLQRAQGDYIAYLGDDDLYYPNHLETLSEGLDKNADVGAVYSDLYAVQSIEDKRNEKRYPLNKFIQVSRDYNRDFMFHFNHTLHVSLMHRKELALRAGGYNEDITVLIDWNMTRKLSFYTDFKYIPVATGEYYMPLGKSDRISNREREDEERFKHNVRKIKMDHPPEPWSKVDGVAVILPVDEWGNGAAKTITEWIDKLSYPVKFILVNNDTKKNECECKETLGMLGELSNIFVHTPPTKLREFEAYRFGVERAEADYVYLPTHQAKTELEFRVIAARHYLGGRTCDGVRWDIEGEKESTYDFVMRRERFLSLAEYGKDRVATAVRLVHYDLPQSLAFDLFLNQAHEQYKNGNYRLAYSFIKEAQAVQRGGCGKQYLIELYAKICFELKQFDEAEDACKQLIKKGYTADNWIRLGRILQVKKMYCRALEAYRNGIKEIGLEEEDLGSAVFPIGVPENFGSFTALIGMGECQLAVGHLVEAAKTFRRAAKLKANSHRTWLGFGMLFLKAHELDKAEEALRMGVSADARDPALYLALGNLCERKRQWITAYEYYGIAFEKDKTNIESLDAIYRVGNKLQEWKDMKTIFEDFLSYRPGYVPAMKQLSSIYLALGAKQKSRHLVERAALFDEANPESREFCTTV